MQDIIIVCAGSFGIEVYDIIESINEISYKENGVKKYNILGFLDDSNINLLEKGVDSKVIGNIKDWNPQGKEVYALGVSNPYAKEKISNLLKERGAKFETLISPFSKIGKNVEFGIGCIVTAYCVCRGTKVGDFVNIMGSMVGHNAKIGDFSTVTGFANTTNAQIGKRVFIGSQAVIMNNIKVGDDSFVSACSMVVRNVKTGTKVFGVPAKKVDW